jgi:translation initiation factor 1 (eIF-1/SUI1)
MARTEYVDGIIEMAVMIRNHIAAGGEVPDEAISLLGDADQAMMEAFDVALDPENRQETETGEWK